MHKFTGKFVHVGFAIADVEKTIHEMEKILGSGDFQIIEDVKISDLTYQGAHTDSEVRVGVGSMSGVGIELIEQTNEAPSPYIDDIRKGIERPHHLAFASSNYSLDKEYLDQQGGEVIFTSDQDDSRFAYFRFETIPGFIIELMELPADGERGSDD